MHRLSSITTKRGIAFLNTPVGYTFANYFSAIHQFSNTESVKLKNINISDYENCNIEARFSTKGDFRRRAGKTHQLELDAAKELQ